MDQFQDDDDTKQRLLPVLDGVVALLRGGHNYDSVKQRYPELSIEDIKACHKMGQQRLNRESVSQPIYCRLDVRKKQDR